MTEHAHRTPSDCPACGTGLDIIRLGCSSCGTEITGLFAPCPTCRLDASDAEVLRVFLRSRGDVAAVAQLPFVDDPGTALDRLLDAFTGATRTPDAVRQQILGEVAAGRLTPDVAEQLLTELSN